MSCWHRHCDEPGSLSLLQLGTSWNPAKRPLCAYICTAILNVFSCYIYFHPVLCAIQLVASIFSWSCKHCWQWNVLCLWTTGANAQSAWYCAVRRTQGGSFFSPTFFLTFPSDFSLFNLILTDSFSLSLWQYSEHVKQVFSKRATAREGGGTPAIQVEATNCAERSLSVAPR